MDRTHGGFHPHENSIYDGLNDADKAGIYETLTKLPLQYWLAAGAVNQGYKNESILKEFIGHSGSLTTGVTGAQGFNYLLPDVIYTALFEHARAEDITPLVSNILDCPGPELKVDAEVDGTFKPKFTSSGGEAPYEAVQTTQKTIKPKTFTMNIGCTNEMLEDNLFNVLAAHINIAGKAMGEFSTRMCLYPIMDDERASATTYAITGTYNDVAAGGNYCYLSDYREAIGANATDGWETDAFIVPPHYADYVYVGAGAGDAYMGSDAIKVNLRGLQQEPIHGVPVVRVKHITTSDTPSALGWQSGLYSTTWHVLGVNKTYGIQTVRKRWLKMENYSDPIKDLVGAVVSARQGHLVAYADACAVISFA